MSNGNTYKGDGIMGNSLVPCVSVSHVPISKTLV